jgi:integrase
VLSDLTTAKCSAYYEALRRRLNRLGRPLAVDSHRSMPAEARMLAKFAVSKRWLRSSPVAAVEGNERRRHGKVQLRIDEARKRMATAIEQADAGEAGAVAAMMALLLGMRASEITSRVVRHLDDDGHPCRSNEGVREGRNPQQPLCGTTSAASKP